MARMRIFFPNASIKQPPMDGPDVHQYQLIKNLTEMGHELITLEPDQNPRSQVRPRTPWSVLKALRSADVYYCRVNVGVNYSTRMTSPLRRRLIPQRCAVIWEFDLDLEVMLRISRRGVSIESHARTLSRYARRVDAAIAVTRKIAQQACELLGIEQATVIQNGSDPGLFKPDLPPVEGLRRRCERLAVAWIGSHTNTVHDATLIGDLCRLIDERRAPIDVHVIGRTADMFSRPHSRCMVMHGPVSYFELPRYLAAMDVGLVLYNVRYDGGSPLKLFDYLASGCVPICSPGQPMEEVLSQRQVGYLDQWTPQSLLERLEVLAGDRRLLDRMSRNGRGLIEQEYNWRRVAEKTDRIMRETLDRRRASLPGVIGQSRMDR